MDEDCLIFKCSEANARAICCYKNAVYRSEKDLRIGNILKMSSLQSVDLQLYDTLIQKLYEDVLKPFTKNDDSVSAYLQEKL